MEHNGNNDINGYVAYGEGIPSEFSSGSMEISNNTGLKKGPWTAVEDRILMEYVSKHGEGNWNSVRINTGLNRCGKSCRLRWANHLRPHLKKGAFTTDEEMLIFELHAKYGNKWARMASQLPGRTDNEIKNYWNTRVKKRLRKGLPLYPPDINPSTTTPQTDDRFNFQLQASSYQNHTQFPPLPSQNDPNSTLNNCNPLFDVATSSYTPSYAFTVDHPSIMPGTRLGYKRYRVNPGFSPPLSPPRKRNSSMLRTSSMPDIASNQQFATGTSAMPDSSSFQFQGQTFNECLLPLPRTTTRFNFGDSLMSSRGSVYPMNSKLPSSHVSHIPEPSSSQVSQTPQLRSSQASQTQSFSEIPTTIDANITANHGSDGFLDELFQEAETFGCGSHSITQPIDLLDSSEKNHVLEGYDHSLASIPMDSSLFEMNQEHVNTIPKYLANFFGFNLSTEPVSSWYNGESTNLPNSQYSSGAKEANLEFDIPQHMDSLFQPVVNSVDFDTVPNSWDNLPENSVEVS